MGRGGKLTALIVIVFVAIAAYAVFWLSSQPTQAADFTLPVVNAGGLTSQQVTLSSHQGKAILLEFMEPWCPVCQNIASTYASLAQSYQGYKVLFIAVAGPYRGEGMTSDTTVDEVASFIQAHSSTMTYTFDIAGSVFKKYGVDRFPTTLIIKPDMAVYSRYVGQISSSTLSSDLNKVIPP